MNLKNRRLVPGEDGSLVGGAANDKDFSTDLVSCLKGLLKASARLVKQPSAFAPAFGALSAARLLLHHFKASSARASAAELAALRALAERSGASLASSGKLRRSSETSCSALLLVHSGTGGLPPFHVAFAVSLFADN